MSDKNHFAHPSQTHAWLGRHKIIFETVAVAVFTLASIFVAWLQWRTAERQADISMRQSQPNFVITVHQVWNEKESFFTDDELLIQNFGGAPRGLRDQITTFLHITASASGDSKPRYADIPLRGYYNSAMITSDVVTGQLVKSIGYRNDRKMADLTKQVRDIAATNGYNCTIELHRYVKLVYSDLFEQSHVEYFSVAPINGADRIPASEGNKWVDQFNESDGVDLNNTTAQEIWGRVMKHLAPK